MKLDVKNVGLLLRDGMIIMVVLFVQIAIIKFMESGQQISILKRESYCDALFLNIKAHTMSFLIPHIKNAT